MDRTRLDFPPLALGFVFLEVFAYPWWLFGFVVLGNLLGWCYSVLFFSVSPGAGSGKSAIPLSPGSLVPGLGYLSLRGSPRMLAGCSCCCPCSCMRWPVS